MIDIKRLRLAHRSWTDIWHRSHKLVEQSQPWMSIELNHSWNFRLWHEEDIARRDDISLERLRDAKRNIDSFNQSRNNSLEDIDDFILSCIGNLTADSGATLHSETPGMMIDRLSIMALKEYHMHEQVLRKDVSPKHRLECSERVSVLKEQQHDLQNALQTLFADLASGRKRFKVYRQFKMYNDPTLNPELYNPTDIEVKAFEAPRD